MSAPSGFRVHHFDRVTSTQEAAAALPVGSVVVADEQTAGKGRLERRWETPSGSGLAATFVVQPGALLSLAAGVAAAEACAAEVRLKWPNDLVLHGRKLGGILVEVKGGRALVGIGINLRSAPEGAVAIELDRDTLVAQIGAELLHWSRQDPAKLLDRWRQLSETLGQRVRVTVGASVFEGVAQDIGDDGALIVDGKRFTAGDVTHLRDARGPAGTPPHDV